MTHQDGTVNLTNLPSDRTETYTVPAFLICAIEYGDYSGLTDDEVSALDNFLNSLEPGNRAHSYSDDTFFTARHDVDDILACDCVEMTVTWLYFD